MDHFTHRNGILHAEDVSLEALAAEIGTPFYCYSTATLERHYRVFAEALSPLSPLICYAAKANGNRSVIATLAKLDAGADVVSEGEIRLALSAGVPTERIIFSGVGKTRDEMRFALAQGIHQFNVESMPELEALAATAVEMNVRAPFAIRVNPDVDPLTHAKISTGLKTSKFGVPFDEARRMIAYASGVPALAFKGISVHIGSQLTALDPFAQAFRRVRAFVEELRGAGIPVERIDLGGGLGIPYRAGDAPPSPAEYGAMVCEVMAGMDARFAFEPGRLLVGNAGILVTRVIYVKHNGEHAFVIVDAAMNDLLRPSLYEAHHAIVPLRNEPRRMITADLVGPVCETGDVLATSREMPELRPGEGLALRSAGAYGASMSSTYNARRLVPEIMVNGGEYAVIRPRPSYEEMTERDALAPWLL